MTAIARLADYVTVTPEVMLAVQFRHRPPASPEERLMLAILEDALACFQRGACAEDTQQRRLFMEACAWIFCRERHWPFSFENICDTFSVEPGYVRCAVAHWMRCALASVSDHKATARPALKMEEALACMQLRDSR